MVIIFVEDSAVSKFLCNPRFPRSRLSMILFGLSDILFEVSQMGFVIYPV